MKVIYLENLLIRQLEKDDLEESLQIIRQSFATVAEQFSLTEQNCPSNGAFLQYERLLQDYEKGNCMFGLFSGGKLCGFVAICRLNENLYSIEKLAVPPEYRKAGYGSMLVDYAKEYIKKQSANTVTIGIMDHHTALKNWYIKRGFIETGTKAYPHLPFTVCFMECALNG